MSGMTSPSHNQDLLNDTLSLTLEFLSDIITDIQTLASFDSDREYMWNHRVTHLTASVSQFVELTTLLSRLIQAKKKQTVPGVKDSHVGLLFILKAMNQAQVKRDYLALEDLIKYELKDNLTQWKIDLIPQTKKILSL
jgi:hypothetical protein